MPKIQKKAKSSNVLKFSFTETLNSHENKTHFVMKGFALSLSFESENLWNSEMACNLFSRNNGENKSIIHFFFFSSPSSDRAQKKKTANQVGWRQLHYKNKKF